MKLDSSAQEDAQRLGEALVERATADAERLKTQALEAAEGLLGKARAVAELNKGDEGTLLGTAAAVYAKEFEVGNCGVDGHGRPAGWPLNCLELRFGNNFVAHLADGRLRDRDLLPGRYRALLVLTRIDE